MEFNSKKLENTSRLVYYAISVVLCAFLILLSNQLIGDLDTVTIRPEVESFLDADVVVDLTRRENSLQAEVRVIWNKNAVIEQTMQTA